MSPIYVRPEREQAEHDRLIRFLQAKYSRKFEVSANPGDERLAPIKVAAGTYFPDLVLHEDKRLAGVVEIETAASVNNLETMAKWVPFSKARVPFHLYVPVQGYEAALRLAEAHQAKASEIWTYRAANDGFDLVRMFVDTATPVKQAKPVAKAPEPKSRPVPRAAKASKPAKRPAAAAKRKAAPARKAVRATKPKSANKTAAKGKKGKGARKGR